MKDTKFLVIALLFTIVAFFAHGFIYCYFFYRSYDPVFVRNLYHCYSAIFMVFAFTLICRERTNPVRMEYIAWGIGGTVLLTIIWEIVYESTKRYYHGEGFWIQWDQIVADMIGVMIATAIWVLRFRVKSSLRT